jgi:hypothetical protein
MKVRRQKYLERFGELSDYGCAVPQREILIVKGVVVYWKYLNIQYAVLSHNQMFPN